MGKFWKKIKDSKTMSYVRIVTESAAFALLVSVILFAYEMTDNMQDSRAVTENLLKIQNSLATRYLGEFPNFVPDINDLYSVAKSGDTIVVIEDVLFYGINSASDDFYEAHHKLLDLAANGSPVTIVYYRPKGLTYNLMMQEWMLSREHYKHFRDTLTLYHHRMQQYRMERRALTDSCVAHKVPDAKKKQELKALIKKDFGDILDKQQLQRQTEQLIERPFGTVSYTKDGDTIKQEDNVSVRNILLERYFAKTRESDRSAFKTMVDKYRRHTLKTYPHATTRTEVETQQMCKRMDTIRVKYLGEEHSNIDKIKYADFPKMFAEMTDVMIDTYSRYPSIRLIPIDDFLSVRGWLIYSKHTGHQAIIAFPSRYSSSEIGFYTTDESTCEYIKTMLRGILINYGD